jgi:hypothetical protein
MMKDSRGGVTRRRREGDGEMRERADMGRALTERVNHQWLESTALMADNANEMMKDFRYGYPLLERLIQAIDD